MYQLNWTRLARLTFADEEDFILRKWSQSEVDKFNILVFDCLESICHTPTIGIYNQFHQQYSLVISKQTTIFYKVNDDKQQIELALFWNNSQNPIHLEKLLN